MRMYLAGGLSGNLQPYFDKKYAGLQTDRQIDRQTDRHYADYLVTTTSQERENCSTINQSINQSMRLYLAGTNSRPYVITDNANIPCRRERQEPNTPRERESSIQGVFILESFYACRKNPNFPKLLPLMGDFLLDSGAFTFMQGTHKEAINWDRYIEEYAEFINRYNVQKFFELDIDLVVGLNEVERLRKRLEQLTGKQPIPVWHKGRGKDYFIGMAGDYPYVAIGGIVSKEIPINLYEKMFPWFIRTAHEKGAKIHGLGYTRLEGLKYYHFDSVDSTTWLHGNRGGCLFKFNPHNGNIDRVKTPAGKRLVSTEVAKYNFNEWVKFQTYAEKRL